MRGLSQNVKSLPPPPISVLNLKALELIKKGADIINFGQGAANIKLPKSILNRMKKLLDETKIHSYSIDPGLPELREAISNKLEKENKLSYSPDEIIVTAGANMAFTLAIFSLVNPGDDVILFSPYYFDHDYAIKLAGGNVIDVPLDEENEYAIPFDKLKNSITKKTKVVVLNYPNNPTGTTFSKKQLEELADLANEKDFYIISDEVYEYFLYDDNTHVSIGSLDGMKERVITINSFSKSYGIGGWRIGYLAANNEIIDEMMKVQDAMLVCAPVPSQYLALILLEEGRLVITDFMEKLKKRKNFIMRRFADVPCFNPFEPKGTFYVFTRVNGVTDTLNYTLELLEKLHVLMIPGSAFGSSGEGHLRISFGNISIQDISEGFDRLEENLSVTCPSER